MASLYRRHRPRTFADVVGQEHVVRTLRNAIEQDKVHHAYLFVGSRGTGKTSMAKILAASLNCVNGPTVTPDGTCESCVSIANATSLDVVEMDAASNNSVDDIRDLRERVAYAPVSGKYKVYILDEAHMLSTAAWNAFLKTLEEPPPNTIFVLATTEAAKVLPTVADRCHRFDFSRPTIAQIASVIRRVAEIESITAPDEAVALMARSATGSFRDALGTLEQLVAYSGNTISLEDVLAVLGAADDELLFGTVDAIVASSARDALLAAARLADSGRDVTRFFGDLEGHLRSLMVVQTLGTVPAELSMTAETDERLADQARRAGPAQVTFALQLLSDAMRAMKDGADPRTQLELALVKAADPARDASQKALLARVERLERGGVQPAPAPHAPEVPATAAGQARAPQPAPAVPEPAPAVPQSAPAAQPAAPQERVAPAPPSRVEEPAPSYDFGDPGPDDRHPDDLPPGPTGAPYGQPPAAAPAPPEPVAPAAEPEPAPVAVADTGELDLAGFREIWPAVLQQMQNTPIGALMAEAAPVACDGRAVTLAFSEANGLFQRQADRPANRDALKAAIRAVTGQAMQIKLEIRDEEELDIEEELVALSEDELIDRVVTEFDATVIDEGDTP